MCHLYPYKNVKLLRKFFTLIYVINLEPFTDKLQLVINIANKVI